MDQDQEPIVNAEAIFVQSLDQKGKPRREEKVLANYLSGGKLSIETTDAEVPHIRQIHDGNPPPADFRHAVCHEFLCTAAYSRLAGLSPIAAGRSDRGRSTRSFFIR